jgi:hypothetical protein
MGKRELTRLKDAASYPVWWLRFVPYARRCGFDRLIEHRDKYGDVIRAQAAAAKLRYEKTLAKAAADDAIDSGKGDGFGTPRAELHRSVSESSSSGDMSGADRSDGSSGLESIATLSIGSSKGKHKRRTIESKVEKKIQKLFDLILSCVSDAIAMKISRKAKGNGLKALAIIEKDYASDEADRAEDLRSEMKDLEPEHFVNFGEYMEALLQVQEKLEVIGKPVEESMIRVFIRDKAPAELKAFIATISSVSRLNLDEWTMEIQKFDRSLKKGKGKTKKGEVKIACQVGKYGLIEPCQLCDGVGHGAKTCPRFLGEKRTCYNCGERGHLSRDCPRPRGKTCLKVDQAEKSYVKAKKAFKKAKVKANKASKKKKKVTLAPSPQVSSEDDSEDDSEASTPSSTSGDDEDSSSSSSGNVKVVEARKAKVRNGKSYLEAASPKSESSDDSHLSWDDYNLKTSKTRELARSRSWDEDLSNKEKMDLMGKLSF